MNWKLLSTAPNQITAESWRELLKVNGFNSKISSIIPIKRNKKLAKKV